MQIVISYAKLRKLVEDKAGVQFTDAGIDQLITFLLSEMEQFNCYMSLFVQLNNSDQYSGVLPIKCSLVPEYTITIKVYYPLEESDTDRYVLEFNFDTSQASEGLISFLQLFKPVQI